MQRTVTRQVRYCSGPDASRLLPVAEQDSRPEGFSLKASTASGHVLRTAFLCVYHVKSHPGCPDHEVQILGDFYGADEVACRLCMEEEEDAA
ncbi:MAG: hypothetical protein ACJ76P_02255 [Actinomycetota bacterium]